MNIDSSSLKRIRNFMQLIDKSVKSGIQPSFIRTPTEHGDNINIIAMIDGRREQEGLLFWDVAFLQDRGLVDTLDDEDLALGLNVTDGMVEDVETILECVEAEMKKLQEE